MFRKKTELNTELDDAFLEEISDTMQKSIEEEFSPKGILDLASLAEKHEGEIKTLADYRDQLIKNKKATEQAIEMVDIRIKSVRAALTALGIADVPDQSAKSSKPVLPQFPQ